MSTIGADPELLFYSPEINKYIPGIGMVGGSKEDPKPVLEGAIQEDGVAAEFNVDPVNLNNPEGFVERITRVRKFIEDIAKKQKLEVHAVASAEFSEEMLLHPQALVSGCDPDTNVYTLLENEYPPIDSTNLRYAGGHLHFGDTEIFQAPGTRESFIKLCDYYIGAPLSVLDPDTERKKTYGAAGNFRYKPYGVEYRTPSNFWLKHPELIRFVVQGLRSAKNSLTFNRGHSHKIAISEQILRHSISEGDTTQTYEALNDRSRLNIDTLRKLKYD